MKHALRDLLLIFSSIFLAIVLAKLDFVEGVLAFSENIRIAGSFFAGLFFTSLFTTVPAIVVLGEISRQEPIFRVAFLGALGALCGDGLIFYFFRNHVANDLDALIKRTKHRPWGSVLKSRTAGWVSTLAGALIIASPLPDELGIAMMGLSRINFKVFVPVSFSFNFLGIVLIGWASRLLV